MLSPSNLAQYVGFTEDEVRGLAREYNQDFDKVKMWYDGYLLRDYQVYNPRAVVSVMLKENLKATGPRQLLMKQLCRLLI